jgi:hypothetical protein
MRLSWRVEIERLGALLGDLVILALVAVVVFAVAVWFGRHVIAPRIGRALDRAETEDDTGDRDH